MYRTTVRKRYKSTTTLQSQTITPCSNTSRSRVQSISRIQEQGEDRKTIDSEASAGTGDSSEAEIKRRHLYRGDNTLCPLHLVSGRRGSTTCTPQTPQ